MAEPQSGQLKDKISLDIIGVNTFLQLRHCQSGILTVVAEWFIYIYQLLPARERAHYYWLINIGQKIDI